MRIRHAAVPPAPTSLAAGLNKVQPHQAKAVALRLESGHVCQNCESQILRIPGASFHWCPTCGVETHGAVTDICMCGAHVGKHDVLLRCVPVPNWEKQMNPLIRRKVGIASKLPPAPQPVRLKASRSELFSDDID